MAISCVYCGASHPDAAGVRACWQRTQADAPTLFDAVEQPVEPLFESPFEPDEHPEPVPAAAARSPRRAPVAHDGPIRRGPMVLGRNVIVGPGDAAPQDWSDAPRVTVSLDRPHAIADELEALARSCTGAVLELDDATAVQLDEPEREQREPHQLGTSFRFGRERVRLLVRANSYDARTGRWALLEDALALGAAPANDGRGDVVLADGTAAWLDGGPVRFTEPIDGAPVLHRVAVEHGSLRPFPATDMHGTTAAELAPDQLAAVAHRGGAARIIAPAGSGKTRVLTERARQLLQVWGLPASAVCLIAFNKRAQEEMRERTRDLRGLQVRTLNAIALAIVNGSAPFAPRPSKRTTIDEPEVRRIIGKLVSFPRKRNVDPVATWMEALSFARLGLRAAADVEARYDGEVDGFAAFLPKYRSQLARTGSLDFDEQVQCAIELLLTDADARATAQRACRVLLVDEFQDLTPAHLLLVRLLAGPDGAVFGVGDDDQTIYGYNGANPAWLIDFASFFPGAEDHPLEVNYRCPGGIVTAADRLLRHNVLRVPKTIRSNKPDEVGWSIAPAGDAVAATTSAIQEAIAGGTPPGDIAVLCRVNSLLAPVQVALSSEGLPINGGVGNEFAERTAVRAALAWLRLATATTALAPGDLAEALRRPSRPLHPNVANWVGEQSSLDGLRRLAARLTTDREAERVNAFADDIERLQHLAAGGATTARLMSTVRDSVGLASSIASLDISRRGMNRAAQNDDLTAVAQLAELQPDPSSFERWLRQHLGAGNRADGITLATVHRVKGQEWPFVVVHQADADQYPHRLSEDVEEERRLFHVAFTRARREALIVVADRPSPFIHELTNEPPARRVGGPSVVGNDRFGERQPKPTPAASRPGHDLQPADAALFQSLRDLRKHLAAGKPSYTVLSDASLADIATGRPITADQLARIRGIGPSKLDRYGAAILAVVLDHADPA